MIEKTIYLVQLFDYYQNLLTERQRDMLALYYEDDYSLAEIGEYYDISRQGVYDNIRRATTSLEHLEATLQLFKKAQKREFLLDEIESLSSDEQILSLLNELRDII